MIHPPDKGTLRSPRTISEKERRYVASVHLKLVFDKLRQNQLYIKKEKFAFAQTCINLLGQVEKFAFAQTCINFLGQVINCGQIGMDSDKIKAIQ